MPESAVARYWLVAVGVLVLAGMVALEVAGLGETRLDHWVAHHAAFLDLVEAHPLLATLAVVVVHALLAALALPGASVLMLVAGSGFGAFGGTLLCLTGCTAGATLTMTVVRQYLQPVVRRRHGERLAGFDARMAADGIAYLFSLRLLPVIPFAVVNVAAGLTTMKTWTFFWVSFVGMAASTFVYVNAGTELARIRVLSDIYSVQVLLSLFALALLPWAIKWMLRGTRLDAGGRT